MRPERSRFPARRLAGSICASLLLLALHGPVVGSPRDASISLPGAGWELAMKRAGFTLSSDQSDSAGTSRMMSFEHSAGRLSFTVAMRPAAASLEETRAGLRDGLRDEETPFGDAREWKRGEVLFLEYVEENQQNPSITKHVHAFLTAAETTVEVHIVKSSFKPYQQKTLDSLTDSLEIIPKAGSRASS